MRSKNIAIIPSYKVGTDTVTIAVEIMAVDGKEHMAIWKSTKRVRVHIGKCTFLEISMLLIVKN